MDDVSYIDCAHHHKDDDGFANRKRLVICCDGTWNNSNTGGVPTNVSRLSAAVAHKCCTGMPQVVYYHRGAGTEESRAASVLGGLLGMGVKQDIVDCYRFICDNYNMGDEIVIVGFSRGAFTARSISSMVCSLGYLNRTGLNFLGEIYQDYQSFNEWNSERVYDPEKHLRAFSSEQLERRIKKEVMDKMEKIEKRLEDETAGPEELKRRTSDEFAKLFEVYEQRLQPEELERQLDQEKRELFKRMSEMKKSDGSGMKLNKMAKAYRERLCEYQMCLTRRSDMDAQTTYEAVEGRVKAVGVWDTVGSLGIPKMPWDIGHASRNASELRFASLDVHANIDHAFHALALDEWRTAFAPTLWNISPRNTNTKLRQVWFPGCHSNVGGGSDHQQISKIALAWMADQLTSVGVEFSQKEMKRIFRSTTSQSDYRPWGLGKITSPDSLATTLPDLAWNAATLPYRTVTHQWTESCVRRPGHYSNDDGKRRLTNTQELVHPSVRIRYLYQGLGLDDAGEWRCKALAGRGWQLMFEKNPSAATTPPSVRPGRDPRVVDEYRTVSGSVTAVYEQYPVSERLRGKVVRAEQPDEADLKSLDPPKNTWSWALQDSDRRLYEEHIGMWERMYIEVNDDMVRWHELTVHERRKRWSKGDHLREMATESVAFAVHAVENVVKTAVGTVFGGPPEKYLPQGFPDQHGYHDFISWQKGVDSKTETLVTKSIEWSENEYIDYSHNHSHSHDLGSIGWS
ncbi:Uncharacterized protein Cob_v010877 [Colletotrichum orbiculare MAFF 240422]|uniref:T6SS Phospholipase effector Tle1-like catalytic domain-containing protein n=1 Tax=Colletotrichum orbiculare (strain 104-T / ATCC 96160 / CBS 514.97 / LARS 414 / MAFF 240422) TaxID=1213857 RepID=A0A484FDL6_COLOR|nr:Uncharacterized protein Cob_v010877 [Colletotrichum orbiculare MAFF 240422]